jgi:hypothetical protein
MELKLRFLNIFMTIVYIFKFTFIFDSNIKSMFITLLILNKFNFIIFNNYSAEDERSSIIPLPHYNPMPGIQEIAIYQLV